MEKYNYIEGETIQNIQILLEEKDIVISNLLAACKEARKHLYEILGQCADGSFLFNRTNIQLDKLNEAINKVEGK